MRRKGVSPVIATLLLIVIAVVAAVLTYIWVSGYMGRVTPQAEAPQLQERIKIDAVNVNGNVVIYVANIGDVEVEIVSAYVLTTGGTLVCGGSQPTVQTNPISRGSTATVTFSCAELTEEGTYVAKVVSRSGVEATYTFTYTP